MHHNLFALEVKSLSRPSQIASYSLSDNLKREESASFLDNYPVLQANTTHKISIKFPMSITYGTDVWAISNFNICPN